MISNLLLFSTEHMPQMISTFGASATIMSPLFELFLLGVAILLIIALFRYTEANSFFRNLLAGYGLFELMRNSFNYLLTPSPVQNQVIHVHPSRQDNLFVPRQAPVIHVHQHPNGPNNSNSRFFPPAHNPIVHVHQSAGEQRVNANRNSIHGHH